WDPSRLRAASGRRWRAPGRTRPRSRAPSRCSATTPTRSWPPRSPASSRCRGRGQR
ncbi:MAG: hypothetical protein AVDCRST_MAG85-2073, partial [uncultured Solirubrobacteraceae bacterium]